MRLSVEKSGGLS